MLIQKSFTLHRRDLKDLKTILTRFNEEEKNKYISNMEFLMVIYHMMIIFQHHSKLLNNLSFNANQNYLNIIPYPKEVLLEMM